MDVITWFRIRKRLPKDSKRLMLTSAGREKLRREVNFQRRCIDIASVVNQCPVMVEDQVKQAAAHRGLPFQQVADQIYANVCDGVPYGDALRMYYKVGGMLCIYILFG